MHYYQFHISDWALHTSHLTLEEEGVYRRLLDHYYDTEQPIPEETGRVIRRLRLGNHSELVGLILDEFFNLEGDGWHNLRADAEIKQYNEKANTARVNGKKGGRPKKRKQEAQEKQTVSGNEKPKETNPVNLANPEKTGSKANEEPRTKNQEPRTNKKQSKKFDVDFSVFDVNEFQLEEIKRIRKINNKGKSGASMTQRVANEIASELKKALALGLGIEACLSEWETRGWRTFKAEWMENSKNGGGPPHNFDGIDYGESGDL